MIYISGIGIVSALGNNVSENLEALINKKSGIAISEGRFQGIVNKSNSDLKISLGVDNLQPISRTSLLALTAAREAYSTVEKHSDIREGIISATSVGGMDITEIEYSNISKNNHVNYQNFLAHDSGNTSEIISKQLNIKGFINTISTACSSGANAIMMGARMIEQGILDRVLVGGSDPLTNFTISGFNSLMIYDKELCKPFDDSRNGLNLGEGAAYLVLESEESSKKTNSTPLAILSGWANASDAYHQTASSPEGTGATLAIKQAIAKAKLTSSDIQYINAHGTGTKNNDLSESTAISKIFGSKIPAFSSTKSYTGHTLAAAGTIEAVFSIFSIQKQIAFPNLRFKNSMIETGFIPVEDVSKMEINHVLSNSFGFGGNNSSIILSKI